MGFNQLSKLAINKNGFVFDPETGKSFTVNDTGNKILELLLDLDDLDKVAEELANIYEVTIQEANRDVHEFKNLLKTYGLIN